MAKEELNQSNDMARSAAKTPIALIGASIRGGIEAHAAYLSKYGPHWDGWTYKNVQTVEEILLNQIKRDGYFNLFCFLSRKQGGLSRIEWRVKVGDVKIYDRRKDFEDPAHGNRYGAYSELYYTAITPFRCGLTDFSDGMNDRRLRTWDGQRLLSSFIFVEDTVRQG